MATGRRPGGAMASSPHIAVTAISTVSLRRLGRRRHATVGRLWLPLALGLALTLAAVGVRAAAPPPHLGYGFMLAYPPTHLDEVHDADFDWFKYFLYWDAVDPDHDGAAFDWTSLDTQLAWACDHEVHLLLRVERDSDDWTPIQDDELDAWGAFFAALAARVDVGRAACGDTYRVALEIWNEPNLDFQWGHQPVDPVRYTEMVRRAYRGVQAGDPSIPVVVGSLAPTGGLPDGRAMNDVAFLEAMYDAGLAGHFDAVSVHNYGYGGEPEDKAYGSGILNFRRAEDIYATMVAHGDGDKAVWSTEFGWLLDAVEEGHPECIDVWEATGFAWQRVSAAEQADYLARAFAYADAHWPWMQVMFVSNLDFSKMPWYDTCDPLRWFAVLQPDGSPRPAYAALQAMPKRPRDWSAWGMAVWPDVVTTSLRLRERGVVTRSVTVLNTGDHPFTWTVATTPSLGLPMTVTPTTGRVGEAFTVTVDAGAALTGIYRTALTVTASATPVVPGRVTVPVRIDVWAAWGMEVTPPSLDWTVAVSETAPMSALVTVRNTGDYPFDWSVTTATQALTLSVAPLRSAGGGTTWQVDVFRVFVDPRGLPVGRYTGAVTVTASSPRVPQSPFVLPVRVWVIERFYRAYLPLTMRAH